MTKLDNEEKELIISHRNKQGRLVPMQFAHSNHSAEFLPYDLVVTP